LSEDSNCYKFGLVSTLRGYEKKGIRHRDITKTVLEKDLINLGSKATWEKYLSIAEHNLKMIKFTLNNLPARVVHSRITSDLIPLAILKSFDEKKMNYELVLEEKEILNLCQEIRAIIEKKKITVSVHSSQFFSLAAADEVIRRNSQSELICYAKILELISKEAVITIQLNSKRELVENLGEEKYLKWVVEAIRKLPSYVLARICLENEVRGFWNSSNLYKFYRYCQEKYQIVFPLAWDNAHEAANPSRISEDKENWEWFTNTWMSRRPLFYWPESCGQNKIGHCDYFHQKILPPSSIPVWVCEIKMKELALQELLSNSKIN
jgi:UV DNA damage repair endonuclease